jgi:hypothetical protein
MLSVIILSVIMLSVIMLSVIVLSVFMLSVIILSVTSLKNFRKFVSEATIKAVNSKSIARQHFKATLGQLSLA